MITLLLQTYRLLRAFILGFEDKEFQSLFFMTAVLLITGSVFYVNVEGWSVLDALYFSVATLTTVGYGDFVPRTDLGKIFTIVYIMGGIGLFLGFINKLGEARSMLSKKNKTVR